ncbi:transposase [Kitasatospora brasiliensis]|uniref:transposase n=1 Tax=Kitasatospora brasiliensis TaxID=3058040 RepID=UPI003D784AB3
MRVDLVPDDLWERVAPLLPPAPERRRRHPGRLRVPDRAALAGNIYVLRTGVAWPMSPRRPWAAPESRPGADCGTGPRSASGPAC